MKLLEANFAQIEHINQIIYNNKKHDSWACFDTRFIVEASNRYGILNTTDPKLTVLTQECVDLRYDFMIVNIKKINDTTWKYSFEIRNALWDGTYNVTKSKNSASDPDETFDKGKVVISKDGTNKNIIHFTISGTDSNRVRICFHMNMSAGGRNIQTTSLKIDNPKEYKHQFDAEVCEKGKVLTEDGGLVDGVDVSIEPVDSNGRPITKGIEPRTVKVVNGEFTMCYSKVDVPGDYYVLMRVVGNESYTGAETTQLIHIIKVQNHKIDIKWGEDSLYKNIHKGSIHTFTIPLEVKNEFDLHDPKLDEKIKNVEFTVSMIRYGGKKDDTQTCKVTVKNGVYSINPKISYRKYYEDISYLEVTIPISSGYGSRSEQHLVRHSWFVADNYTSLANEIEDSEGADFVLLKPQTYERTKTISLTREITIAGITGNTHCLINGKSSNIFTIDSPSPDTDNYMKVNIVGIALTNANSSAININKGCRLLVDRCYFTNNKNSGMHQKGSSIYMPVTDETKAKNKLWKTEIRNSRFHNNIGNEIQSIGNTLITNNMFTTYTKECLQQPEVKVVAVRAGSVTYKRNKSYIKIPFTTRNTAMSSNHCYAKALTYVDKNCTFNGVGPSSLCKNNSLPLYGEPWNNQAYTRCCYYYPHGNVKTEIICSPEKKRERSATGHASACTNWVYYDGYYFVSFKYGPANTYDPWTEEELALPTNTGIYDTKTEKFINGYDPLVSNNKAQTSELD